MNAAIIVQLLITAIEHAAELSAVLGKANAEGRDVTDAEVAAVRAKAKAAVDALAAAVAPP